MNLFIKDTTNKPSASLTIALVAFVVCSIGVILSLVGGTHVRPISESLVAAYLGPCLALYFGRRHTQSTAPTAPAVTKSGANMAPDGQA